MGKQKGAFKQQGKLGDLVFYKTKFGYKTRAAPTLSEEVRKERSEREQNQRTGPVNRYAGAVGRGLRRHADIFIDGSIYRNLLSAFKKCDSPHLSVMLDQIKKTEVRTDYPVSRFSGSPNISIDAGENGYHIEAEIFNAADEKRTGCFYLQFILLAWKNGETECRTEEMNTEWMSSKEKFPKYLSFEFGRMKSDSEYLLAVRCVRGINQQETDNIADMAMRFCGAGTLTKAGMRALEDHRKEQEQKIESAAVPEKKEKVRMKVRDEK